MTGVIEDGKQWVTDQDVLSELQHLSTLTSAEGVNSESDTTGPLWVTNTWTGAGEQNDYSHVGVVLQVDEEGVLFFDFSLDGANWSTFPVAGFTVHANINEVHTAVKLGRFFRPRFVGTGGRTYYRLRTYYTPSAIHLNSPLNMAMNGDTDGLVVKAAHQVQYTPTVSMVEDGDHDTPSITKLREIRTRDQVAIDVENCNDASLLTALNAGTTSIVTTSDHVFGTGATQFSKTGTASVFAGVQRTITAMNIGETFEDGGFVACGVKIPSIANVDYVFMRLGTNSTNYNEWRWDVDALSSGEWLQLRRATAQPSAFLGTGWDDDAVTYVAFGVAFNSASNTLAGIIFDNVHLVQGRITDTTIVASIDSAITGNKVDVHKIGSVPVDKNIGNASGGTQRVVLASDQPTISVTTGAPTIAAPVVGNTLSSGDLTVVSAPGVGQRIVVRYLYTLVDPDASNTPILHWKSSTGAYNLFRGFAISKTWTWELPENEGLVLNLSADTDASGAVYTVFYAQEAI